MRSVRNAALAAAVVIVADIGVAAAGGGDHRSNGPAARDGPVIEDAAGRFVARLASSGEMGAAMLPFGQGHLLVQLGLHTDYASGTLLSSGLGWQSGELYFVAEGCIGAPHIASLSGGGGQRFVVSQLQAGQWVAHVGNAALTQRLSVRSMRDSGGNCRVTIDRHVPLSIVASPVQTTLSLDAYGRPPFYVD